MHLVRSSGTHMMDWFNVAWAAFQWAAEGDLFNPAPRLGFAWDPFGNGGLPSAAVMASSSSTQMVTRPTPKVWKANLHPSSKSATQNNITGYANIGTARNYGSVVSLQLYSIPKQVVWPYMQQWHLDVQHELPSHIVATLSYVGSKGTHLGRQRDLNQLHALPASLNPYQAGQPISSGDCDSLRISAIPL